MRRRLPRDGCRTTGVLAEGLALGGANNTGGFAHPWPGNEATANSVINQRSQDHGSDQR
jgi:hypothetical protein